MAHAEQHREDWKKLPGRNTSGMYYSSKSASMAVKNTARLYAEVTSSVPAVYAASLRTIAPLMVNPLFSRQTG
jgi:hypothetical protein